MRLVEFCATFVGVVALLLLPVAQAVGDSVLTINGEGELQNAIAENPFLVVEFFAPWCGHCQHLAPEYNKAASILKDDEKPIILAAADMTTEDNKPLMQKFGIQGFPTLKMFRDGEIVDYNGPRQADGIVSYLRKLNGPAFIELTVDELASQRAALEAEHDVLVVASLKDESDINIFKAAANKLREKAHLILTRAASAPDVVVHSKAHGGQVKMTEPFTAENFELFVHDSSLAPFGQMTPQDSGVMQGFLETKRKRYLVFVNAVDEDKVEVVNQLEKSFEKAGVRRDFFIGWIDAPGFPQATQHFGIADADIPTVLVVQQEKNLKFKYFGGWNVQELTQFAVDVQTGKAEPFFKSQEPVDNSNNDVLTVVHKNFNEIVRKSGKETLLKVYAPWCGHCKAMAPAFEAVAKALKDEPRVQIAEIDGTLNDMPEGLNVRGYPTLFWFAAGENTVPAPYEEARSAKGMLDFIKRNSQFSNLKVGDLPEAEGDDEDAVGPGSDDTLAKVLNALDANYHGFSGWQLAGGAIALSFLSIVFFLLSFREGGSKDESGAVEEKRKEKKEKKSDEGSAPSPSPKKKGSSGKSKKEE